MITKKEALQLLNKSKVSLIDYKSITELQKDELLSELNFIEFDNLDISPTQMFRELSLEQILENRKKPDFFVIDGTHLPKLGKSLKEVLEKLEILMIRFRDSEYKLIVTFMSNNSIGNRPLAVNNTLMYSSDLVLGLKQENTFRVLKSREHF